MKALTLIQPWATLIALGEKRIETRSWPTKYRGLIAIHAGKKVDGEAWARFEDELNDLGVWHGQDLPTGAVIAIGNLTGCVSMTSEWISTVDPAERPYGFFAPGRFGWIIEDVKPIPPIPARGQQGLWDIDLGETE